MEKRICLVCTGDHIDNLLIQKIAEYTGVYGAVDVMRSADQLCTTLESYKDSDIVSSIDVIIGLVMPAINGFDLYENLPKAIQESSRVLMIAVHLTDEEHKRLAGYERLIFVEKNLTKEGLAKILTAA